MKYVARITIRENPSSLLRCFGPAGKGSADERSKVTFEAKKDCLEVNVEASDSVALRAVLNNVTKLCTVYENLEAVK